MPALLTLFSGPAGFGKSYRLNLLSQGKQCAGKCYFMPREPELDELTQQLGRLIEQPAGQCLVLDDLQCYSRACSEAFLRWVDELDHLIRKQGVGLDFRLLLAARPLSTSDPSGVDWPERLSLLPFVDHVELTPMRLMETASMLEEIAEQWGNPAVLGDLGQIAAEIQEQSTGQPFVSRLLFEEWLRSGRRLGKAQISSLIKKIMSDELASDTTAGGALLLLGTSLGPISMDVLSRALAVSDELILQKIASWISKGFLVHSIKENTLRYSHDLLREHAPCFLPPKDQAAVLARAASALPKEDHGLRCSILLSIVSQDPSAPSELGSAMGAWMQAAPGSVELEELCFRVLEGQGAGPDLRQSALRHLLDRHAYERHRRRWLGVLENSSWTELGRQQCSLMSFTLVPTLDHTGQLPSLGKWLERLTPEIDEDLLATIRLDFAMNRVLRNDQKSLRKIFDGDSLRLALSPDDKLRSIRIAQIKLAELCLSHDIVGDPGGWLHLLEEFYQEQGSQLDPWSHDRLVTLIVDSAGRARDGQALQRWLNPAIESAKEVAKVESPLFGRARVARRKLHFGMAGDSIDDLLVAAEWHLARGNLRMALPDLDAAATSHFKNGRTSKACAILREVEALVLAAPEEFLSIAFRINASAPFLANGEWTTARIWIEKLEASLENVPQVKPSWAYAMIQILDCKAMGTRLDHAEFDRLNQLCKEQLRLSPPAGQRSAELKAAMWVNSMRQDLPGPTLEEFELILGALEEHNINPRAHAVSQLAEIAFLQHKKEQRKGWEQHRDVLFGRMVRDAGPNEILFKTQLARLKKLSGDRVESRACLLEASLCAWNQHSSGWMIEHKRLFPRVRLDGLVKDQARDSMSFRARMLWLDVLESQCHPGPRYRSFGIDLSQSNSLVLLEQQLALIGRKIKGWRNSVEERGQLDQLELRALALENQLSEFPDLDSSGKDQVGLRVAMIGEIALFGGNEELSTIRLGNGIFRELFAFFVVERWRHPGRAWPARELIKRIWRVRARHHDELLNSFYVYISHMRALLKSSGFPGCLEHVREGYRIHRDCPIELDLQQFEAGLNEFKAKPGAFSVDDGIALLERYKHPIDSALTGKWLDELRAWHEQRWFALHERMFSKQIDQSQEKRLAILADRFYTD